MQSLERLPRYRWAVLAVIWMSYMIINTSKHGIGPLAPFLKEAFNLSNAEIGLLVTASVIGYIPSLIVAGWLVDYIGVRRLLVAGTLISGFSITAVFFAPQYQVMFVMMIFLGIGNGCIFLSAVKAVILWFPARERAIALGLNQAAVNVAGVISASLLPTIAIMLGWRYGFLFLGFSMLVIVPCCAIIYQNPPKEYLLNGAGDIPYRVSPKSSIISLAIDLLKSRDIWMLSLAGLFLAIVEFATMTYLVLYLNEELLFPIVAAGGMLAMTSAAGGIGKPASGFVSDRLLSGHRKKVFLLMASMASVLSLIIGFGGQNLHWVLYPVLILLGIAAIGWGGLFITLVTELAGTQLVGRTLGISSGILHVGVLTGPPLFGYIVDSTGSYQAAWFTMALSGAIAVILISLVREHRRRI